MTRRYDLSGRSSLSFDERDTAVATLLAARMDPFQVSAANGGGPGVRLEPAAAAWRRLVDVQHPARDGTTTAWDGERLLVLAEGRCCSVPAPGSSGEAPARFAYEPGFPVRRILAPLVRPALQLSLHARDAAAVHSATVEIDGRAVLVAGWSESGKTETALALAEAGGRFLSDKWTVLGTDGDASAFPINVGVRRWVLPFLPRLRAALPRAARAQLGIAGVAAAVSRPLRRRTPRSRLGSLAERAVGLADRAALTPSEVRAAYGQDEDPCRRVAIGATVVLTTVPGPGIGCREADPRWAARRLARSAAYERRELFAVLERGRYARASADGDPRERAIAADAQILEQAFSRGRTLEVRAPFPVDPRRVVAALEPWL